MKRYEHRDEIFSNSLKDKLKIIIGENKLFRFMIANVIVWQHAKGALIQISVHNNFSDDNSFPQNSVLKIWHSQINCCALSLNALELRIIFITSPS